MSFHIAIDASRTTIARLTGTEHYALELIRALIALTSERDDIHLTLYFRDQPAPDLFLQQPHVTLKVIPFRRLWTHLRFATALWRDRPDVTFVPAHTLPVFFPGRAVVTVHDLGFRYFPEAHPVSDRRYLDLTTWYSARRASLILADSAATAADLHGFYGTPAEKVRVVYPGVEARNVRSSREVLRVRQKYGLPERYFVFVGTLQPRKNIARIVQAYARYRELGAQKTASAEVIGLVLAGGQGWLYDPAWTANVPDVFLPGYIDDDDKTALYAGAVALVFPSLYEGFGFPVVEAMHAGTPVITSNTSSLPELGGDAAMLVNPLDVEAIANAMIKIADDSTLYLTVQQRGYERAAKFTWEAAAIAALDALETAAGKTNVIKK